MLKRYLRRFNPRSWSNDELRLVLSHCQKKSRVVNVSGWQDRDKEGDVIRTTSQAPLCITSRTMRAMLHAELLQKLT